MAETKQESPQELETKARLARLREYALKGDGRAPVRFEFAGETYGVRSPHASVLREATAAGKKASGTDEPDGPRMMSVLLSDCIVDVDSGRPIFAPSDWQALEKHTIGGASFFSAAKDQLTELMKGQTAKAAEETFTPADAS